MKVFVEMNITILDGPEKGKSFNEKSNYITDSELTEFGTVETLKLKWHYIHEYPERIKEVKYD